MGCCCVVTRADESAVRAINRRLRVAGLFVGGTWARRAGATDRIRANGKDGRKGPSLLYTNKPGKPMRRIVGAGKAPPWGGWAIALPGGGIVVTHIDITVGMAFQGRGKPHPYISSRKVSDD